LKDVSELPPPILPVGRIKQFGPLGPKYEIRSGARQSSSGQWVVPIRLVETGEQVEYDYSHLLQDPDAA
jgi:hypothetical protein